MLTKVKILKNKRELLLKTKENLYSRYMTCVKQLEDLEDSILLHEKGILKQQVKLDAIEHEQSSKCKYMKKCGPCARAKGRPVNSIMCKHPDVPEEYWKTRTDEKCSVPLEGAPEGVLQFCKYYEPKN